MSFHPPLLRFLVPHHPQSNPQPNRNHNHCDQQHPPRPVNRDQRNRRTRPQPAAHKRLVHDLFAREGIGRRRLIVRVHHAKQQKARSLSHPSTGPSRQWPVRTTHPAISAAPAPSRKTRSTQSPPTTKISSGTSAVFTTARLIIAIAATTRKSSEQFWIRRISPKIDQVMPIEFFVQKLDRQPADHT